MNQHDTIALPSRKTFISMAILWCGFILATLNMRMIFASVGPLLTQLNLGVLATLLVTTLPPVLLGLLSVIAIRMRHSLGEEKALAGGLLLLTFGCALRWFGEAGLIAGTIVGSAGIATMNIIVPVLARKRFPPSQTGLVMGVYALMLGLGAVIAAGSSFPLYQALGGDTAAAFSTLAICIFPSLLALIVWLPQLAHQDEPHGGLVSATDASTGSMSIYKSRLAWSVTLFFGLQALNLYAFLAWLPTIYIERGTSPAQAAFLLTATQVSLTIGGFFMPVLAARSQSQKPYIALTVGFCLAGTLGILWTPVDTALVWVLLLGFGQGAGPALGAYLFIARSGSHYMAAQLSLMAQLVGYLIAALGPLAVGVLRKTTGGWTAPILLLAILLVIELIVALPAGARKTVADE